MICQHCGAENADSCTYCVGCGAPTTPKKKHSSRNSHPHLRRFLPFLLLAATALVAAGFLYFLR